MNAIPKLPAGPRGPMFEAKRPSSTELLHPSPAKLIAASFSAQQSAAADTLEVKHASGPAYAENHFETAVQRRAAGVREPAFVPFARVGGRGQLPLQQDVLAPEGGDALIDANPAAVSNVISTGASVAGPIAAAGALLAGTGTLFGGGNQNSSGS